MTDIAERRKPDRRNKALVQRIQMLMQSTIECIYILDDQGNVIEANEALCKHLGYSQTELLQLNIFDFEAKLTADEVRANIKTLLNNPARFESLHRRKDGSLVNAEVTASGVKLDGGKCLLCLCHDITARKLVESKLKKSERHLREAQSIAHIGSWDYDLVTLQLMWTEELYRIYGVSPKTFIPSPESLISLIHPDDQPAMRAWIGACVSGQEPPALEFRCVWPDGQIRYIEGQGELSTECNGEFVRMSGTAQDITERRLAEHELAESMCKLEDKELAKSRFFAAAGHDLRQPLAAANLFIDALKFTEPTPQQSKILQQLDHSMATFGGLLDSLLNISKLDSGVIKPEFAPINVTEVFIWIDQNFAPMISEKQLGFKLYFPLRGKLVVLGDIGLLNSVLINLVSNAVKFTSKGAILVSARKRGNAVLFQVWDTGMGITDENIEHIFDEFYQVGNPQRDRSGGLGLGLAIAKRAATLLGSKITCRSRIGRGSVFEFRLPLDSTSGGVMQPPAAASQEDLINNSFSRGKNFIVVEDDALVAQAMTNLLEGMGGEVQCFVSAEDALLCAKIEGADYYIVDYMLAGALNGVQFLNLLRQKLGKPIKAVLLTGDTSTAFIREAASCDWPVLYKPINIARLISNLSAQ